MNSSKFCGSAFGAGPNEPLRRASSDRRTRVAVLSMTPSPQQSDTPFLQPADCGVTWPLVPVQLLLVPLMLAPFEPPPPWACEAPFELPLCPAPAWTGCAGAGCFFEP